MEHHDSMPLPLESADDKTEAADIGKDDIVESVNDKQQQNLPIYTIRQTLMDAIEQYPIITVVGETGSGKTTQFPQWILEKFDKIAVTQPRRVAAVTVCERVKEEMGSDQKDLCGYKIRFVDRTSDTTRLVFMTDGILLRLLQSDPVLRQFNVVILDEAHERSLETDILFGMLKSVHGRRPDLKIVVMSATLDSDKFSKYFNYCPIIEIPGRHFDVDIFHMKSGNVTLSNYLKKAIETVLYIHQNHPAGDILVFLTGQSEIEYACRSVLDLNDEIDYDQGQNDQEPGPMGVLDKTVRGLSVLPLYASLDPREQRKVFEPIRQQGRRKIVFSTNIAATSVTIPNIRYVVDCGFVKQKEYDARLDMDGLLVTRISKAAADQRAGRAGRTMHGVCWRLYSSEEYEQFPDGTCPEVQRTSLTSTVLTLKSLGVQNILSFPFMDSPEQESIMTAGKRLYLISALSETGELTNKGEIVSKFPISPALAVALITSSTPEFHCSREMATICAVLSSEDIYEKNLRRSDDVQGAASVRSKWAHRSGDHLTLLNIVLAFKMASSISKDEAKSFCYRNYLRLKSLWNCLDIESQLLALMQKLSIPINTSSNSAAALKYINRNDGVPFEKSFNFDFVDAERIQYRKILKALLHSFYGNLARKSQTSTEAGSHTLFYHYASTLAPASNSSNYLALSLDQNSSLISNVRDLEWVFFNDISYTNRATMRICSRVFFDYVPSELIDRLKNNQSRQFMEQLVGDSGQLAEKRMLEQKQAAHAETNLDVKDHDSVIETIKKRAVDENAVEDARQRYLERKKRQRN